MQFVFLLLDADPQTPITNSEIFCNLELERVLPDDGIESSLSLHLLPSTRSSCKRIFRAPPSHGFFVHLHRINNTIDTSILPNFNNDSTITKKLHNSNKDFINKKNSTRSCPISVVSIIAVRQQNENSLFLGIFKIKNKTWPLKTPFKWNI